jgi:LysR family transcriptional regulator (chromosome initiation inhibitor)
MRPLDYKLIHALDSIIQQQSFDKAAKALHMTQSAISQRIKQLEQLVAQPVLIRSHPLKATAIGQKLLVHFRQVRQLEYDLADEINHQDKGKSIPLSIAVNADSLASWFIPALAPLLKEYPLVLDLQVADESRTQELFKRGEVFSAISNQKQSISGCKVQRIGNVDYILCASPEFKEKYFPKGINAQALKIAPGIEFDQRDTMDIEYLAESYGVEPGSYPCHTIRSSEAFVSMAIEGLAYCLLPHTQANAYLSSGRLIDLAPKNHLKQTLYWHSWILEKGIYKKVSEHIVEYGKKLLL